MAKKTAMQLSREINDALNRRKTAHHATRSGLN